jgi:hypothetical protein
MVSRGGYIIVEDSHIDGVPNDRNKPHGLLIVTAVETFLFWLIVAVGRVGLVNGNEKPPIDSETTADTELRLPASVLVTTLPSGQCSLVRVEPVVSLSRNLTARAWISTGMALGGTARLQIPPRHTVNLADMPGIAMASAIETRTHFSPLETAEDGIAPVRVRHVESLSPCQSGQTSAIRNDWDCLSRPCQSVSLRFTDQKVGSDVKEPYRPVPLLLKWYTLAPFWAIAGAMQAIPIRHTGICSFMYFNLLLAEDSRSPLEPPPPAPPSHNPPGLESPAWSNRLRSRGRQPVAGCP